MAGSLWGKKSKGRRRRRLAIEISSVTLPGTFVRLNEQQMGVGQHVQDKRGSGDAPTRKHLAADSGLHTAAAAANTACR